MRNSCSQTGIRLILAAFIVFILLLIVGLAVLGYYSYQYFHTPQVNCRCKIGVIKRIVNGHVAPKNFVPYQVSLAVANGENRTPQHFCSGVIVNAHWVLTAAHCLANLNGRKIVVRVGVHELNETNLEERSYYAFRSYSHPSFQSDNNVLEVRDIGLIRLFYPINFIRGQVEPSCLNLEEKKKYDDLLVTGYGTTERSFLKDGKVTKGGLSNVLKYAWYYENSYAVECRNWLICGSPRNKFDSTCHGDSGGPISFTRNGGNTTVEGIASYTVPLEGKDKVFLCAGPTGYARLQSNKDWIEEHVGSNYCGNFN